MPTVSNEEWAEFLEYKRWKKCCNPTDIMVEQYDEPIATVCSCGNSLCKGMSESK